MLTNRCLVRASSSFVNSNKSDLNFSFLSSGKDKSLNVIVKPSITFEKDYEIILPQLHDFLTNQKSSNYFNISQDAYIPILRKYRRLHGKEALKTWLEVNYLLICVKVNEERIITQIPVDWTIKQVVERIW